MISIPLDYLDYETFSAERRGIRISFSKKSLKEIKVTKRYFTDRFGEYQQSEDAEVGLIKFDVNGNMIKTHGLFSRTFYSGGLSFYTDSGFYKYDDKGLLIEAQEGYVYRYKYDEKGELAEITEYDPNGELRDRTQYINQYDKKWNKTEVEIGDFKGYGGIAVRSHNFKWFLKYNKKNELIKGVCQRWSAGTWYTTEEDSFEYNDKGDIIKEVRRKLDGYKDCLMIIYRYDEKGKIIEREEHQSGFKEFHFFFRYKFDERGNKSEAMVYSFKNIMGEAKWIPEQIITFDYKY